MVDPVRRRGFGRAAARRAGGGLLPVSGGGLPVSAAEAEEAAATRRAARRWSPPRAARAPLRHRSPLCPCQRARRVSCDSSEYHHWASMTSAENRALIVRPR